MRTKLEQGSKLELPFPREEYGVPGLPPWRVGWTLSDARALGRTTVEQATGLGLHYDRPSIYLKQVHGTQCVRLADGPLPKLPAPGDGIFTHRKDLLVGVSVADCMPLYVLGAEAAAVLHAGWRGVLLGMLPRALEALVRHYGVSVSELKLVVGPHIGPCCFEVSTAVWMLFPEASRRDREGRLYVDLVFVIKDQWQKSGGTTDLLRLDRCTSCSQPTLHSFRRDGGAGRNFAYLYHG